jgi:hypothetical protein
VPLSGPAVPKQQHGSALWSISIVAPAVPASARNVPPAAKRPGRSAAVVLPMAAPSRVALHSCEARNSGKLVNYLNSIYSLGWGTN